MQSVYFYTPYILNEKLGERKSIYKKKDIKKNHILKSCRIRMYSNGRRAVPFRGGLDHVSLAGQGSLLLC